MNLFVCLIKLFTSSFVILHSENTSSINLFHTSGFLDILSKDFFLNNGHKNVSRLRPSLFPLQCHGFVNWENVFLKGQTKHFFEISNWIPVLKCGGVAAITLLS